MPAKKPFDGQLSEHTRKILATNGINTVEHLFYWCKDNDIRMLEGVGKWIYNEISSFMFDHGIHLKPWKKFKNKRGKWKFDPYTGKRI